jgi:hypothetical protein
MLPNHHINRMLRNRLNPSASPSVTLKSRHKLVGEPHNLADRPAILDRLKHEIGYIRA